MQQISPQNDVVLRASRSSELGNWLQWRKSRHRCVCDWTDRMIHLKVCLLNHPDLSVIWILLEIFFPRPPEESNDMTNRAANISKLPTCFLILLYILSDSWIIIYDVSVYVFKIYFRSKIQRYETNKNSNRWASQIVSSVEMLFRINFSVCIIIISVEWRY